jgi:hypothetical protein
MDTLNNKIIYEKENNKSNITKRYIFECNNKKFLHNDLLKFLDKFFYHNGGMSVIYSIDKDMYPYDDELIKNNKLIRLYVLKCKIPEMKYIIRKDEFIKGLNLIFGNNEYLDEYLNKETREILDDFFIKYDGDITIEEIRKIN